MIRWFLVGLGGFFGAMARYGMNLIVSHFWSAEFPLATFLINVTGSFLLGLFSAFAMASTVLDVRWRLLVATGFIGAYTTFSTLQYETNRLVESGGWRWALLNVVVSVVAGFVAVRLGTGLGR